MSETALFILFVTTCTASVAWVCWGFSTTGYEPEPRGKRKDPNADPRYTELPNAFAPRLDPEMVREIVEEIKAERAKESR